MATDVDVQYFSHLNGLTLGNNWGDLIRLLDKALVTGIDFTQITAASIDEQGDVHITLYSAHNAMLFQVVELSGFTPTPLNQKYRIKGVPNTTQLILKPALDIAERSITAIGTGKLASLNYEIIFRDANDVKRVYRAKNPTAQHPFIRVDESLASPDGASGIYPSTYAKFAMVGLLEYMNHIDDFENPEVLQLPFTPSDPTKNWKITGTGTSCVRGWSKWYWATSETGVMNGGFYQSQIPNNGNRVFTLVGDIDAFYILTPGTLSNNKEYKLLYGVGLYESSLPQDVVPAFFSMAQLNIVKANVQDNPSKGKSPLLYGDSERKFIVPTYNTATRLKDHIYCNPILLDNHTGMPLSPLNATTLAALEIPMYDEGNILRGTLKHVCYAGNNLQGKTVTTPIIADNSMYIADSSLSQGNNLGGLYFYLGEIE